MDELREKVAIAHRILHQQGLADYLGHASARIPGTDRFYIKGIILSLQKTTGKDVVMVDLDGKLIEGTGKPPAEVVLHGEMYRARPDVGGVVHSHQKWACAFGIAGARILPVLHPGISSVVAKPIPVFDSAELITKPEQAREVARLLGNGPVCHLRNHGVVVVGRSIEEAVYRSVNLERQAELNFIALQIGTPKAIPDNIREPYLDWEENVLLKKQGVSVYNSAWTYFASLVA